MQSDLFTILIPLFINNNGFQEKGSVRAIISTCTIFKRKLR